MSAWYANIRNYTGEYKCKAKVCPKMKSGLRDIGTPDLLVLFTNTVSHKMIRCVLSETKGQNVKIARSHSSPMAALKTIIEEHERQRRAERQQQAEAGQSGDTVAKREKFSGNI